MAATDLAGLVIRRFRWLANAFTKSRMSSCYRSIGNVERFSVSP